MRIDVDSQLEFDEATSALLRQGRLRPAPGEAPGDAHPPGTPGPGLLPRRRLSGRLLWWLAAIAIVVGLYRATPSKKAARAPVSRAAVATDQCRTEPRSYAGAAWWQAARTWINVRRGPGQRHASMGVIGRGALALVRAAPRDGWLPVQTGNGLKGWVRASLGYPIGPLPCDTYQPPAGVPVCNRPARDCAFERRTGPREWWAVAGKPGPAGWQAVYLKSGQRAYVPR